MSLVLDSEPEVKYKLNKLKRDGCSPIFYICLAVNKSHEKTKTNNVLFPLQILSDFQSLSVALWSKITCKQLKMGHKHEVSHLEKGYLISSIRWALYWKWICRLLSRGWVNIWCASEYLQQRGRYSLKGSIHYWVWSLYGTCWHDKNIEWLQPYSLKMGMWGHFEYVT